MAYFSMQCVEHSVAQRIANLRVQKPENAPFLPSENRFFPTLPGLYFVPAKLAIFQGNILIGFGHLRDYL